MSNSKWWFLNSGLLEVLSSKDERATFIALLPDSLVQGHYGFCNEFLWPLMHDLPQHANYSAEQHEQYNSFNRLLSEHINVESNGRQEYFIQDYQLALAPKWLALYGHKAVIFWHIPWPKNVPQQYINAISELARGLLGASDLGFHTQEYAKNFMHFVADNLDEYEVDWTSMTIETREVNLKRERRSWMRTIHTSYVAHQNIPSIKRSAASSTQLLVHPLGIDVAHWIELKDLSMTMNFESQLKQLANGRYVLSVDRVDYTKSLLDRLHIINSFFEQHPQWLGQLSFVQVCGRSRAGLAAFDQYWHSCRSLAETVNQRWQQDNWEPVCWIDRSLSNQELAYLYANADTMLVNPVRDGLNLTAKEFVACQGEQPGTLLLSSGAGVIHEFGKQVLRSSPDDYDGTVDSLARSLVMPLKERQARMLAMKTSIVANQLSDWWSAFNNPSRIPQVKVPAAARKQIPRRKTS